VAYHIAEVLKNVNHQATSTEERTDLRLITLIHDTFKYRVNPDKPKSGENHHALIARRFAERYLDDQALLDIIELHDEAYNSWQLGERRGDWKGAEERATRLVSRLGKALPLYVRFYRCDNETGSKSSAPLRWFESLLQRRGYQVPALPSPDSQGKQQEEHSWTRKSGFSWNEMGLHRPVRVPKYIKDAWRSLLTKRNGRRNGK
jgi:hypothetical protein